MSDLEDRGVPRTPGFGRWLATAALPRDRRQEVLGDLEERFRSIHRDRGALRATVWYLGQASAFAVTGLGERIRGRDRGRAPSDAEGWMAGLLQDARFALRGLARNPGFTAVAVLTLALGIGGTTAVFSVVDGVLLRPLPFPDPGRLVAVLDEFQGEAWWSAAPANVRAWRDESMTLAGVGWAQPGTRSFSGSGAPEEVRVQRVSAGLLDVLGIATSLGRGFREAEALPGAPAVAVLTYGFWARLGSDPASIGGTVALDGIPHTVVGVLRPGATRDVLGPHQVLVPRVFSEDELRSAGRILRTVARLTPGASISEAEAELERIMRDSDRGRELAGGNSGQGWGVRLVPLRERLVGDVRPALFVLLGAIGFVLLVACANVSNLLLARGSARGREFAVRSALGAGRGRIVRLLMVEAGTLAVLGGLSGTLMAVWGADALIAMAPNALPRMDAITVDGRVMAFAFGTSLVVGLLFGLAPAARTTGGRAPDLLGGSRGGVGSARGARLRDALVSAEVAFVLVLLVGAGLMLTSFSRLRSVDPGFPLEDRVVLEMTLPEAGYDTPRRVSEFFRELTRRLAALPGVAAAGAVTHPPLLGDDWSSYHIVEGQPQRPGEEPIGGMEAASPGYFEALGLPLIEGRSFRAGDGPDGPPIVIVDETMATRYWPDGSALGGRVRLSRGGPRARWHEVVGVVGAAHYELGSDPRPRLYVPDSRLAFDARTRYVVVETEPGRLEAVVPRLRAEVRSFAPDLPIASLRTLDEAASASVSRARLQTFLVGTFGVVGLALGAIGVYGVVSYTVSRRTREMGVRMALGAGRGGVLVSVLGRAMAPVLIGLVIGLTGALWLGRFLEAVLFQVSPASPPVLAAVTLGLLLVASLAALVPGLRATRVDPVAALRAE